jgi:hypothetical protein
VIPVTCRVISPAYVLLTVEGLIVRFAASALAVQDRATESRKAKRPKYIFIVKIF